MKFVKTLEPNTHGTSALRESGDGACLTICTDLGVDRDEYLSSPLSSHGTYRCSMGRHCNSGSWKYFLVTISSSMHSPLSSIQLVHLNYWLANLVWLLSSDFFGELKPTHTASSSTSRYFNKLESRKRVLSSIYSQCI